MSVCGKCGAFGDLPHTWAEDDCLFSLHDKHRDPHTPARVGRVCRGCISRWSEWISEIVDLYAAVPELIEHGSVPDDTAEHKHAKHQKVSPAPWRMSAFEAHREGAWNWWLDDGEGNYTSPYLTGDAPTWLTLSNWAQAVSDAQGWVYDRSLATVTSNAALITTNLPTLAALPDVDTFDAELAWVRRFLRTASGITDPEPLFRCLNVHCGGNVWKMTTGHPTCDRCARRYTGADYVRGRGNELHDRRRLRAASAGSGRA